MRLDWAFSAQSCVCVFQFFFFSTRFGCCGYCSCTVQWTVAANFDFSNFFDQSQHIVYCLRTHKFHFSTTFSLKMGPTILFTHLKIISLQCFSVFSFSFQFSAVSKRTHKTCIKAEKQQKIKRGCTHFSRTTLKILSTSASLRLYFYMLTMQIYLHWPLWPSLSRSFKTVQSLALFSM